MAVNYQLYLAWLVRAGRADEDADPVVTRLYATWCRIGRVRIWAPRLR